MVKRLYPVVACAGILLAVVTVVAAQLRGGGSLDPLSMTISDYAARDGGRLIKPAMALLGVASLALLAGMRAVHAPIKGWPARLLGVWSAALIAAAVVPSTAADPGLTYQAAAHLCLSAATFISVPAAAALLADRLAGDERWKGAARPVEWLALTSGLGLAAITYVALPGHGAMIGLVERLLLTAEVAVLGVLAVQLLRLVWAPPPLVGQWRERRLGSRVRAIAGPR
jgi:Protein of unknown function (DUF998)